MPGARIGEPDARARSGLVGPHRYRAADDVDRPERAEVAPVEAARCARAHHEDLAAPQRHAARPCGERASATVAGERPTGRAAVDADAQPMAADALAAHRGYPLEQRNAGRQIAAFGEQAPEFGRRVDRDAFAGMQAGLAADRIEPGRNARGYVPHRMMRDRDDQRRQGSGRHAGSENEAAPHRSIARRRSHARWRARP